MVVKNLNEVLLTIPGLWPDVPFTLHYQFTRRILHNVERMSTGFGNELDLSSSYEIGLDKKTLLSFKGKNKISNECILAD